LWPQLGAAESRVPRLRLMSCHVPDVERRVSCGTWEVFEDRGQRKGRKIALRVVALPAKSADPLPDPLFYFSGGPGEAATHEAALIERDWGAILSRRDIVLVDARGTGDSNPLACSWGDVSRDLQSTLSGFIPPDLARHCRPELETRADLRFYTTSIAVDDVDDVRQALGYQRVNIGGGSYGTR